MYRTHHCNQLRNTDIGREVSLAGWVAVRRDHGGVIFIDLRDREGLTQVVFRPEENAEVARQSHGLRTEDVIQVCGKVAPRLPGTENLKLPTGEIEVLPQTLTILNRAENLPFQLDAQLSNEDLELTYRYFDLNPKPSPGEIEVLPQTLTILNRAENLPFQLDAQLSNEDLELTYRYFD